VKRLALSQPAERAMTKSRLQRNLRLERRIKLLAWRLLSLKQGLGFFCAAPGCAQRDVRRLVRFWSLRMPEKSTKISMAYYSPEFSHNLPPLRSFLSLAGARRVGGAWLHFMLRLAFATAALAMCRTRPSSRVSTRTLLATSLHRPQRRGVSFSCCGGAHLQAATASFIPASERGLCN
jgi:hypothetical protein